MRRNREECASLGADEVVRLTAEGRVAACEERRSKEWASARVSRWDGKGTSKTDRNAPSEPPSAESRSRSGAGKVLSVSRRLNRPLDGEKSRRQRHDKARTVTGASRLRRTHLKARARAGLASAVLAPGRRDEALAIRRRVVDRAVCGRGRVASVAPAAKLAARARVGAAHLVGARKGVAAVAALGRAWRTMSVASAADVSHVCEAMEEA